MEALDKDPVAQAVRGMHAIKAAYLRHADGLQMPFGFTYALCFPNTPQYYGDLPASLSSAQVWTADDLGRMEARFEELFASHRKLSEPHAAGLLLDKVLNPSFNLVARLGDRVGMFRSESEHLLTEEQQRILEETELDSRKAFLGGAGTGKTFIAKEKARRLAAEGHRVLATWYNVKLAFLYEDLAAHPGITAAPFLEHLLAVLGDAARIPEADEAKPRFYNEELVELARAYYAALDHSEKFDAVIVDEGQDFRYEWLLCLQAMLKPGGQIYLFADPHQNVFGVDGLQRFVSEAQISRHQLTRNFRNSKEVTAIARSFARGVRLHSLVEVPGTTHCFAWKTPDGERRIVTERIKTLLKQGARPEQIVILSISRKAESSFADASEIEGVPIAETPGEGRILFSTIRTFKGLEADFVLLIGVTPDHPRCTPADLYVGASRARYLLYLFHRNDWASE